jgi:hypothetical protein
MSSFEEIGKTPDDVEIGCRGEHELGLDICLVCVVPHHTQDHADKEGTDPVENNHSPLRKDEGEERGGGGG